MANAHSNIQYKLWGVSTLLQQHHDQYTTSLMLCLSSGGCADCVATVGVKALSPISVSCYCCCYSVISTGGGKSSSSITRRVILSNFLHQLQGISLQLSTLSIVTSTIVHHCIICHPWCFKNNGGLILPFIKFWFERLPTEKAKLRYTHVYQSSLALMLWWQIW